MFGFKHIRFDNMSYIYHYKNGRVINQGRGLSFFYFAPKSSIVAIPMGSNDLPFIFEEITGDYQRVFVQGEITYKIVDTDVLSNILDFTVDRQGLYNKSDLEKLNQRIINEAQTAVSKISQNLALRNAIRSASDYENLIMERFKGSETIALLGVEVLAAHVLSVQATPEMARALETETREKLQQEADEAIYERRIFAVEQEQKIQESELNTEIAVEEKQKQIDEKKMEGLVQKATNDRKLREMKLTTDIVQEQARIELIKTRTANERKEAETQGYVIEATLKPYKDLDWKVITALGGDNDPSSNLALAFRELAQNANKIGNLNLTPDLLQSLMTQTNSSKKEWSDQCSIME